MPVFDMVLWFALSIYFAGSKYNSRGSFGNEGSIQLKMRIDSEKEKRPITKFVRRYSSCIPGSC
jgi:hypothetical protein